MRLIDLSDGLHERVPHEVYHERHPAIASRTGLEKFLRSAANFKEWLDNDAAESAAALEFGSAAHCALLEPDVFGRSYAVEPDFGDCRFKENKATRDEWRKENADRKLITAEDDKAIRGICRAVREHLNGSKLLAGGCSEVTALWIDEATGLRCKARADYYVASRRMIVDVKTCQDARAHAFRYDASKYGYDRQQAFYSDGFRACGAPIDRFVFLCVEKTPPFNLKPFMLDVASVAQGHEDIRKAMAGLSECLKTNHFPGYDPSIQTISLPRRAA